LANKTSIEKEEWKKIFPFIQTKMHEADIDNDPVGIAECVAKIAKGETSNGKGYIFLGSVGSGKTKRVKFISNLCEIDIVSADRVGAIWQQCDGDNEYFKSAIKAGYEWRKYDRVPTFYQDLIVDDLGCEATFYNCFGNTLDVMKELIYCRYEVFPRWRTFFTTNLTRNQLKERYGERCYSRLCEMCGFIPLTHPDRRMSQ
jgi:DNA replication protein DnaC